MRIGSLEVVTEKANSITESVTMAKMKIKITTYLTFLLLISLTSTLFFTSHAESQIINDCDHHCNLALTSQIDAMKFKLQQLEHRFETTDRELYTKDTYIVKYEKQIEELSQTIHHLESDLSNIEEPPKYEQGIQVSEKQVHELEAGVRKNDKEIQLLKHKVEASEKRVDLLASRVKTIAVIVSELWFHIQKLEQAQEVIERRTAELGRYIRNQKCSLFKFINSSGGRRYHERVAPYTSEALNLLKKSLLAVKKYHHQLQVAVKHEMDKHELTGVLAGDESVFLLVELARPELGTDVEPPRPHRRTEVEPPHPDLSIDVKPPRHHLGLDLDVLF
ncbi:hypothetical protein KSS87_000521 [Heliosperma pusillum]|nr:hypothetical protein KSS87_000521 [Heliosperma pusillum]